MSMQGTIVDLGEAVLSNAIVWAQTCRWAHLDPLADPEPFDRLLGQVLKGRECG